MPSSREKIINELSAVSYVGGREASAALPAVESLGPKAVERYLETGRDLFLHDREVGKHFFHSTAALVTAFGGLDPWLSQARVFLFQRSSGPAAEGYFDQAATIHRRWGLDAEEAWFDIGAQWLGAHMESAAAYFHMPAEELFGSWGVAGLQTLLKPAEMLLQKRMGLRAYLKGAIMIYERCGLDGLNQWVMGGIDVLNANRRRGEAWFRLESEESRQFMQSVLPGFQPGHHERFLSMILQAWTGLQMPVERLGWPDSHYNFVETDGKVVYIPSVMTSREEAILAFCHIGAHLSFDSYNEQDLRLIAQELGQTYLAQDAQGRIIWAALFDGYDDNRWKFQRIFDICEDFRVDVALDKRMPGYIARLQKLSQTITPPEGRSLVYWQLALQLIEKRPAADSFNEFSALMHSDSTVVDSFHLALKYYASSNMPPLTWIDYLNSYLPAHSPNMVRPVYMLGQKASDTTYNSLQINQDSNFLRFSDTKTIDRERSDTLMEIERQNSSVIIPRKRPKQDSKGLKTQRRVGSPPARGGRSSGGGLPQPDQIDEVGHHENVVDGGIVYPEWDYKTCRYKAGWAHVYERPLREKDSIQATRIAANYHGVLLRLKRALQAQKPSRMAPIRRQSQGDELDLDATVQFIVERHAGRTPKTDIYQLRRPIRRDMSVLLLADLSTSIMANINDSEIRIVDHLRAALLLFGEALLEVGDAFAMYGFASKYRDEVLLYPMKRFGDTFDNECRATIGGLSGRLATRMGAAIRHSAWVLQKNRAQRQLLLILTDGRPADYDDGGDDRYLLEDTHRAVKETQEQGIHPFCISIDPNGGEYLPAIFGAGHYLVLKNINSLPQKIPEIYLRLRRGN
ncbi:nitric oxide reductase activation protein NorD [Acidithiobacillus ferriphilus]|uniref:nitric oxide reductase activation protein NorD n=1 Tax=Acidithiobacillus ferriphilus TaxID=1689834 RepID=UPI001C07C35D|nr:VWA domain-containing protein [Acidithiobacillus ferriphilus]